MALNLPNPRNVFLPELPLSVREVSDIEKYLKDLRAALELQFSKGFDNTYSIVSTGTSGTFTASGGNTITVQSGIITSIT
jgi:hypothetical protein